MRHSKHRNQSSERHSVPSPSSFDPIAGHPEQITPNVRRILCPNPSPMTFRGTNTYLVGTTDIAVIDPGPENDAHLDAIVAALKPDQRITHIVVTHSHLDHSPLSRRLSDITDAPIYAFGDSYAGRRPIMSQLDETGLIGGGEGVDTNFTPDITVDTGSQITGHDWVLNVLHTPGHFSNHIALGLGDIWFTGDHIMGWSTSLVSPPDGDLTAFMASCHLLAEQPASMYLPGHGDVIDTPHDRLTWLIEHRLKREAQILEQFRLDLRTIADVTAVLYSDIAPALRPMAERNVLAHVIDLVERNVIEPAGSLSLSAEFKLL